MYTPLHFILILLVYHGFMPVNVTRIRWRFRAGRTGGRGSVPCRHRTGPTWSLTSLSTHPLPLPRPSARWGRRRRPPLPASAAPPRPAPPRGSRPAPCAPALPRSQPTGRWERDGERGRVALLATRSPVGPSGRDTGPTAGPAPSGGLGPADDSSRRERVRRRRRRRRREGDGEGGDGEVKEEREKPLLPPRSGR
jgi:hypothetical protein